jgi:hypothetical protein
LTIGSGSENDIVLAEPTVSRRHVLLRRRFGRYRLIDLESTNGTFVNGRRVEKPTVIARGDELRLGGARLVFLESPGTRELQKRIPLSTKLALLLVVCAASFAATQDLVNRSLRQELAAGHIGASTGLDSRVAEPKTVTPHSDLTPATTAKPVAAPLVGPDATSRIAGPDWLRDLNHWRALASVKPIREEQDEIPGATAHARYMVKNYLARNPETPHREEPSNPWYTPEGAQAAPKGDELGPAPGSPKSPIYSIDWWMDASFHRLTLLNRNLAGAAFARYCESGVCAAVLVLDSQSEVDSDPTWFSQFPEPVMFPPNRMTLSAKFATLISGEWPEPLSCAGYKRPAGYPITLQFDYRFVPKLLSFTLSRNGTSTQMCGYDGTDYSNPDPATQAWGRSGLKGQGAVVLIPRQPLTPGVTYTVTVSVQAEGNPFNWPTPSSFAGQMRSYTWTFTVVPKG